MLYPVKTPVQLGITLILVTLLVACTSTQEATIKTSPNPAPGEQKSNVAQNHGSLALSAAKNLLGTPYRYGGTSPSGFDCSGLVQYSYAQAGLILPRSSQELFRSSERISLSAIQPGDLIFFQISQQKISHVGIYDSNDRFIHAPSSGKGVCYASLENSYWRERLVGAGRF